MSFGEGNLRNLVYELERENAKLRRQNDELRDEAVEEAYVYQHLYSRIEELERELTQARMHIRLSDTSELAKIKRIEKLESLVCDLYLQLLNAYDRKELDWFEERMAELRIEVEP